MVIQQNRINVSFKMFKKIFYFFLNEIIILKNLLIFILIIHISDAFLIGVNETRQNRDDYATIKRMLTWMQNSFFFLFLVNAWCWTMDYAENFLKLPREFYVI